MSIFGFIKSWFGFNTWKVVEKDPLNVIRSIRESFLPKRMLTLDIPLGHLYDLIKGLEELPYGDFKNLKWYNVKVKSRSSMDLLLLFERGPTDPNFEYSDILFRLVTNGVERPFMDWYSGEYSAQSLNTTLLNLLPKAILYHRLNNEMTFYQSEQYSDFTALEIKFYSSVTFRYMIDDYLEMIDVLITHHQSGERREETH